MKNIGIETSATGVSSAPRTLSRTSNGIGESTVRAGFECASEANIEGWDGYYAQVAVEEGVETILTLDDDFRRIDGVSAEVILSSEEFATLNDYLNY